MDTLSKRERELAARMLTELEQMCQAWYLVWREQPGLSGPARDLSTLTQKLTDDYARLVDDDPGPGEIVRPASDNPSDCSER